MNLFNLRSRIGLAGLLCVALSAALPSMPGVGELLAQNCLICWEVMVGGEKHHVFLEGTEFLCDDPELNNEDCAACGLTSQCHFEPDVQPGPCHVACGGQTLAQAETQVEEWLAVPVVPRGSGHLVVSRSGSGLLTFDRARGRLELHDCTGAVVRQWYVSVERRHYIVTT